MPYLKNKCKSRHEEVDAGCRTAAGDYWFQEWIFFEIVECG
jgi:hypothetical protein